MPNLNYPDYSQGFGGYRQTPKSSYLDKIQTSGTTSGAMTGNPYLAAGGLALDLIGTGVGAYGAYQQNKAIEEQNELARQIFEEDRRLAIEKDKQRREDELLGRDMGYGGYARDEESRILDNFGGYAQRVGL